MANMLTTGLIFTLRLLISVYICSHQIIGAHGARVKTSTVASFNIQNLGPSKVARPETLEILRQILSRYDIVAVQEIQDKSQTSINDLLNVLNKGIRKSADRYDVIVSKRVGNTRGEEEQYGLIYKKSKVRVLRSQHYNDVNNYFSRVPFLTEVKYLTGNIPSFVVVNIHAKPDGSKNKATVSELDHLVDVYDFVNSEMGVKNVILVGDMNADGSYIGKRDWKDIRLRSQSRFQWLIPDDEDTTVGDSDNAYDRIIVAGDELQASVVANSAKVYRFNDELGKKGVDISLEEALQVSDHYPVEVKIRLGRTTDAN